MQVLIIANGEMGEIDWASRLVESADLVIAADGGANYCVELGHIPDILIGDFDSIKHEVLREYGDAEVEILRHPPEKDATDLELALDLAVKNGAELVFLLGALGGRWDMSLANIMLAAAEKYKDMRISFVRSDCTIQILQAGRPHVIEGFSGQTVSLIPLRGDVQGVTLTGLQYELRNQKVNFGSSLGVSNVMSADKAAVCHTDGILLCIQESSAK